MSTTIKDLPRPLAACLLGALVAVVLVAATQTRGSAQAADDFVGPGESIQKAINAADPGDTIAVRGVHDHRDNNVNGRVDELGEPCWIS